MGGTSSSSSKEEISKIVRPRVRSYDPKKFGGKSAVVPEDPSEIRGPAPVNGNGISASFDPSLVIERLNNLWSMDAEFGKEREPFEIYLDEMVGDRFVLISGMQVLRDELQMAMHNIVGIDDHRPSSHMHADLSIPSVLCTLAHTNCGDRVDTAAAHIYHNMVASRFCAISELGEPKPETFNPTGGGTEDGATLAHVTIAHTNRTKAYLGNPKSFSLACFDLKTHCGKVSLAKDAVITDGEDLFTEIPCFYGQCRESPWRESRAACGAIVGCLRGFNPNNSVHVRLRRDLGEQNFNFLTTNQVLASPDQVPVTFLIAAAIVAIRGLISTATALANGELDERGVGSLTAAVTINSSGTENIGTPDNIIYLARCTVFNKSARFQGFGTDARLYTASIVEGKVVLTYDGVSGHRIPPQDLTSL